MSAPANLSGLLAKIMNKSLIKSYLNADLKISHVSFRGTTWRPSFKFPVVSVEYNEEFGLMRVKFMRTSYGIPAVAEEIVESRNVTFYDEKNYLNDRPVTLDTFLDVDFWFLKTDCCGQYGAGIDHVTFRTKAQKEAWEKQNCQTLDWSWLNVSRRNAYHACD